MGNSDCLMIRLKPAFQKDIFQGLVDKEGGSIKAGKILSIPASSVRGYKNLYFDSVPKTIINKLIDIKITSNSNVKMNTTELFDKRDLINSTLTKGREKRTNQLKKWKNELPRLKRIFSKGYLNFEKWFLSYQKLINFGARKFNYIKSRGKHLEVSYRMHSNGIKKDFVLKFPRKIKVDDNFIYFFGLWCGDRAGGGRFGVCNQNKNIIKFVEDFLGANYQKIERILYISKGLTLPPLNYDKKFVIDKEIKGWVLSVHSTNGIFSSFFRYLQQHLTEFLSMIRNRNVFFAGLFDAEGNVSLHNKSFRWACKNPELIRIYTDFLGNEGLYNSYDGKCLIAYDREKFYKEIYPYLKHNKKANYAAFLCRGKGALPREVTKILRYFEKEQNGTAKEIAKALKENKVYSELKLLSDFGFVSYKGFPHKFTITPKGLKSLGDLTL